MDMLNRTQKRTLDIRKQQNAHDIAKNMGYDAKKQSDRWDARDLIQKLVEYNNMAIYEVELSELEQLIADANKIERYDIAKCGCMLYDTIRTRIEFKSILINDLL